MTHMFKKQSHNMLSPTTTTSITNSSLGMHRDSRVISKIQPKIRIIHIFAPEIIKTDVANFRELVQRLTGKPSLENDKGGKGKGKGKKVKLQQHQNNNEEMMMMMPRFRPNINTKLEVTMGGSGSSSSPSSSSDHQHHHQQQHQHEGWRTTTTTAGGGGGGGGGDHISSSGGYLTGFTDLDYSFDFNTMFNLGPNDASSHHLNSLGETTQLSFRG